MRFSPRPWVPSNVGTITKVVAIAACTIAPAIGLHGQVPARDSLGIQIVATDGPRARAASQITVSAQPELQIGVIEGDPAYMFSRIAGVALLPVGGIAVVDQGSSELRFYDAGGRIAARRGGAGQGPGELANPRLLNTIVGDSLAVFSGGGRRFTFYSPDGAGFRTLPGANAGPGSAQAASGAQVLMTSAGPLPARETRGLFLATMRARLVDLETGTADTLAVTPYPQVAIITPGELLPTFVTPPYTFPMAAAARDDRLLITTLNEPSVLEYSWAGELRRIIRLSEPLNRVTSAELSAAVERQVDRYVESLLEVGRDAPRAVVRGAFDRLQPPSVEPTFQSLIVDNEGWLWAQTFEPFTDNSRTWLVFDADGRGQGSVTMPEGLTVRAISGGHVAGVWRDEFDVEYVRLYRIAGRE